MTKQFAKMKISQTRKTRVKLCNFDISDKDLSFQKSLKTDVKGCLSTTKIFNLAPVCKRVSGMC